MRPMRNVAALLLSGLCALALSPLHARTTSVVTFEAKEGIVILDSMNSRAAYRLFESLNVPTETRGLRQVRILAPGDGHFRIACEGVSTDYACAVIVYRSAHARLDFDTDRVELTLPAEIARTYGGLFAGDGTGFHFRTEDGRLVIDWSPERLHILGQRGGGQDI